MKKKNYYALICALMVSALTGCGNDVNTAASVSSEKVVLEQKEEKDSSSVTEEVVSEELAVELDTMTDDQAIQAIRNYCVIENPDLERIIEEEQYPVYWEIASSDENEIVVLFRSYTGVQKRFYIERSTGDTYATEFVPGITDEEERTDEHFNAKDYYKETNVSGLEAVSMEKNESVSTSESEEDTDSETTMTWVGDWHETKLDMYMTVTQSENGYKYVITWPDPKNNMTFVWEINGTVNEAGLIAYTNGVASVIEKDENGNETTSILSNHEQGTLALLLDGSLQWIEEVEVEVEHIFERN